MQSSSMVQRFVRPAVSGGLSRNQQLERCSQAIALCEHQATAQELADARALLDAEPLQKQPQLNLGGKRNG